MEFIDENDYIMIIMKHIPFMNLLIPTLFLTVLPQAHELHGSIPVRQTPKIHLHKMTGISILKAIEIASSGFKGRPVEAELEVEDGYLVYEVELSTGGGNRTEVIIDAGNGSILKNERETEDEEELHFRKPIISLGDALKTALTANPGYAVEAELERKIGQLIFCIEIIDSEGKIKEIEVDAGTGKIRNINGCP